MICEYQQSIFDMYIIYKYITYLLIPHFLKFGEMNYSNKNIIKRLGEYYW